jgi:hypothetical protein
VHFAKTMLLCLLNIKNQNQRDAFGYSRNGKKMVGKKMTEMSLLVEASLIAVPHYLAIHVLAIPRFAIESSEGRTTFNCQH